MTDTTTEQPETPGTEVARTESSQAEAARIRWSEDRARERAGQLERLERSSLDSWAVMLSHAAELSRHIANTDFVPAGLRSEAAVTAATLYGRELGLGPMTALQGMHSVKGKVGLSAELMRSMVLAAGHGLRFVETNSGRCVIEGRRKGDTEWTTVTYTLDDARQAGLLSENSWKAYPRQKLIARASAELCRMIFADVTHGMAALEELQDDELDAEPQALPAGSGQGTKVARTTRKRTTSSAPKEKPAEPAAGDPEPPAPETDGAGAASPDAPAPSTPDVPPVDDPPVTDPTPENPVVDEVPAEDAAAKGGTIPDDEPKISQAQQRKIRAMLTELGRSTGPKQREVIELIHGPYETSTELTVGEATKIIETLTLLEANEANLEALLDLIRSEQGGQS